MKATKKQNHAEQNADGHANNILDLYKAHKALEAGAETVKHQGYDYDDAYKIRELAEQTALHVQIRGGWHTPGDTEGNKAEEFTIMLTTGGPNLRIIGELSKYGEPDADNSRLEIQDWGTPWTEYSPKAADDGDWESAFAWFLSCFYMGE